MTGPLKYDPNDPDVIAFARTLRKEMSDAERRLWRLLRDRRLEGFKFRRQYPVEPYVLDFYCHEARLCIEVDGGQHGEPEREAHDAKRTAFLARKGIRVLRFWNDDVLKRREDVLRTIYEVLWEARGMKEKTEDPHP